MRAANMIIDDYFNLWGVELEEHKGILKYLIATHEDLIEFMENFYNGDILASMMNYQKHKRKINNINVEEFDTLFQQDGVTAMEELFQEPLEASDIDLMKYYNLTHLEVYNRLINRPAASFHAIVKTSGNVGKTNGYSFLISY